ncbi:MAG: prepilin-type N-terminal cleavage/methylation domain-containing protein [Candidatus Gracilibacteria bacterium]|nr:prepilin-type N-terminal cleavage/methylation domain-containing protein [Candidatus Gracilibacteria bacterium]
MKVIKNAFTIVELVVVITILSILGTIAFVSYLGYTANARDSVRVTDIENINKVLDIFESKHGFYPQPDGSFNVNYSGTTAWTQGYFGDENLKKTEGLSVIPVDPLTGSNYAYSVSNNKKEVEFASILEDSSFARLIKFVGSGFSFDGKELGTAYVKGNYNGKFIKVSTGSTIYILGVPSILTSDILSVDVVDIYNSKKFVYNGYNNLPHTYTNTSYSTNGGFNFSGSISTNLLFEGAESELATGVGKLKFAKKLSDFYSNTILDGDQTYSDVVNLNPLSNPNGAIKLIDNYISNKVGGLKYQLGINDNYSISDIIDFEREGGYTVSQGSPVRDTSEKYGGNYSLKLGGLVPYSWGYSSCININKTLDYPSYLSFKGKSNFGGYIDVYSGSYLDGNYILDQGVSDSWSDFKSGMLNSGTYNFDICFIGYDQLGSTFIDDVYFDYTVNGFCGINGNLNFYQANDISYPCTSGVSTPIVDNGVGQKFTWSCQGSIGGVTENCSVNHIGAPTNIIDFETNTGYSVDSGTWNQTNTDKFSGDYSLNTGVDNSCLTVSKTVNSNFILSFSHKAAEDTDINNGYIYSEYNLIKDGIELGMWMEYEPFEISYSNGWVKIQIPNLKPGDYELQYCVNKGAGETGSMYFDYVTFDTNGICGNMNGKSSSVFIDGGACSNGILTNFIDNGVGSTYNWDCESPDGGSTSSCSSNHILQNTTYPGCDSPDINISGMVISSCNVGSTISGTGSSSYGGFFQWGRNKMFAVNDNSQQSSTIPGSTGLNAGSDTYNFVWGDTLPWGWSDDDITGNWGGHHGYYYDFSYQSPTEFTLQQGPCASGYHVPDSYEWNNLAVSGGWINGFGTSTDTGKNMADILKIPYAGGRSGYDGTLMMVGEHGCYWASDAPSNNLTIGDDVLMPDSWGKGSMPSDGLSVRCFKN